MIVGLDPGEAHCGLVAIEDETTVLCSLEVVPEELFAFLEELPPGTKVAYETFALYPWAARPLSYSSLTTVETIGVIKYISEKRDFQLIPVQASEHKMYEGKLIYPKALRGKHQRDAYSITVWALRFR